MQSETLLPCPFCGRAPISATRAGGGFDSAPWVSFLACMCGGYTAHAHHSGYGQTPDEARSDVAARWNTRANAGGNADG